MTFSGWGESEGKGISRKDLSFVDSRLKLKDASSSIKRVLGRGNSDLLVVPCSALHVSFGSPCRTGQSQVQGFAILMLFLVLHCTVWA